METWHSSQRSWRPNDDETHFWARLLSVFRGPSSSFGAADQDDKLALKQHETQDNETRPLVLSLEPGRAQLSSG